MHMCMHMHMCMCMQLTTGFVNSHTVKQASILHFTLEQIDGKMGEK